MKTKAERLTLFEQVDIYPVISSEFTNNRPVLDILKAIADGGAKIVQLREKNKSKRELYNLAVEYRKITDRYNMLLIMNDHLDIALSVGADGVHLGQDDFPVAPAHQLAPDLIIGNSTHDLEEAHQAIADGADYINIGPIYPTQTKNVSCGALGLTTLKEISAQINIPFTVMGGIKMTHIPELLAHGARRIAMVTEITQAEDVRARVELLRSCWK